MMGLGWDHTFKSSAFALSTFSLTACAVATQPALTSTQSSALSITNIELLAQEDDETAIRSQFHAALSQALSARGVTTQAGAETIADFAVSARGAELGLQEISEDAEADAPITPDFEPRWYHKCKPDRVNASLVLYSRVNGAAIGKSSGEYLACAGDLSQLGDLAKLLVDEAIAP